MRLLPLLLVVGFAACSNSQPAQPGPRPVVPTRAGFVSMRVEDHLVHVLVASDEASRGRGLAGHSVLAADEGMLFVYPEAAPRSFWMQGCLLALDIVFLDAQARVLNVVTLPPPAVGTTAEKLPTARSVMPARYVLELPAGTFARLGLGAGAHCTLPTLQGKQP